MNAPAKIISISDRMALVHRLSAERAAERVHRANSILDEAFALAACDCENCRTERWRILCYEAQERRLAEQIKRDRLRRAAWWAIVAASLIAAAWAILA
jgi:hypothetical protein